MSSERLYGRFVHVFLDVYQAGQSIVSFVLGVSWSMARGHRPCFLFGYTAASERYP